MRVLGHLGGGGVHYEVELDDGEIVYLLLEKVRFDLLEQYLASTRQRADADAEAAGGGMRTPTKKKGGSSGGRSPSPLPTPTGPPSGSDRPKRTQQERLRTPWSATDIKLALLYACAAEGPKLFNYGRSGRAWERVVERLQTKTPHAT